jgi:predicted phage terminase large subunit-like protein
VPEHYDQVVQSWDTANKLSEFADYSVCTTWGLKDKRLYLLHVLRRKVNYPDLKRAVCEQANLHRATVILIEDKASGTQLVQELIDEGLQMVKAIKPEGDKIMRLNAQTATIENGFVYLPREASWLADYLHELTTFPASKYDDQADSTSQALAWIKQSGAEPGSSLFIAWKPPAGCSNRACPWPPSPRRSMRPLSKSRTGCAKPRRTKTNCWQSMKSGSPRTAPGVGIR